MLRPVGNVSRAGLELSLALRYLHGCTAAPRGSPHRHGHDHDFTLGNPALQDLIQAVLPAQQEQASGPCKFKYLCFLGESGEKCCQVRCYQRALLVNLKLTRALPA